MLCTGYRRLYLKMQGRNSSPQTMEENIPKWFDKRFLTTVLEDGQTTNTTVNILSFNISTMELPIKNFTSYLYKVDVTYKEGSNVEKNEKLIIKEPISEGIFNETSKREPIVYHNIIKKMFQKTGCYFGPKAYRSPIQNFLIMENLKEEGYTLHENAKQLDFSHCEKVFVAIAKFHAASIACYHDDPNIYDIVGLEVLYKDQGVMEPWVINSVKAMIECADELGDKQFADFLRSKENSLWEAAQFKYKPDPAKLNVFNHGDLHKKNILFKYDESGKVVGVKFVDFQNTRYCSPVLDLIYFMWTSANEEVRENKQQELYHIYLQTLNKSLEDLGCIERLTVEMLEEELKWAADWTLITLCVCFPLVMSKPEEAEGIVDLKREDFETMKFKKLFYGDLFRPLLKSIFRQFTDFFLSGKKVIS